MAEINRRPYPSQKIVQGNENRKSRGSVINLFHPAKQLVKTIPLSFAWYVLLVKISHYVKQRLFRCVHVVRLLLLHLLYSETISYCSS